MILGLFLLVLGALILPLFGISLGAFFTNNRSDNSSGYSGYNGYGYDQPEFSGSSSSSGSSESDRPAGTFTSFSRRYSTGD